MKNTIIIIISYIIIHLSAVSLFYLIDINNTALYLDPLFNGLLLSILAPMVILEVDNKLNKQ